MPHPANGEDPIVKDLEEGCDLIKLSGLRYAVQFAIAAFIAGRSTRKGS